jgi:hypothetical protein
VVPGVRKTTKTAATCVTDTCHSDRHCKKQRTGELEMMQSITTRSFGESSYANTNPEYDEIVQPLNCMRVPVGISAGDKIRMIDMQKSGKAGFEIIIPSHATEGMALNMNKPDPLRFQMLLVDGINHQVCGSLYRQHSVRLTAHRNRCKDLHVDTSSCPVFGCSMDDNTYNKVFPLNRNGKAAYDIYMSHLNNSLLRSKSKTTARRLCF